MQKWLIVLMIAPVFALTAISGGWASGCGKDCGKHKAAQTPAAGCRVMFNSGILYDGGIAITVSAPKGWVIDDKSGVSAGLHAVFYPEGSSWEDADSVMYAEIVHKGSCGSSSLEKVMQKDAGRSSRSRLEVTVEDGGILKTTKGKDAQVRLFYGGENKAAAYVDEEKAVARLVLSFRTEDGLKAAMPAFREFVGTYLFVSDTVVNRNCMSGPDSRTQVSKGRKVEAEGTVNSIGSGGEQLAFVPDGADGEVVVRADRRSVAMLKPGDRVKVAYIEGELNVATKVLKKHRIKKLPKPCVLVH